MNPFLSSAGNSPTMRTCLRTWLLTAVLLLLPANSPWTLQAADKTAGGDDVIFRALGDELKRSMTLHLEGLDQPYFIQFDAEDTLVWRISAGFGALDRTVEDHTRMLHSQLRVGNYDLDNSNFIGGRGGMGRRGVTLSTEIPVDDDYMAIRHAIWQLCDIQFKDAVETLTQKKSYLKERTVQDRPADFSKMQPASTIHPAGKMSFDRKKWENYTRSISASMASFKHLQDANVSLFVGVETHHMINSEGSRLRLNETGAVLRVTMEALADDGETLADHLAYCVETPAQLPSLEEVIADAAAVSERLSKSIKAPVLEDYVGPVLMDETAAPMFFRQLLARGLASNPDPIGSGRTGRNPDDLESRLGKRILPATFQIYDDPTKNKFENTFLTGQYEVDDEGNKPRRVNLVVDGKLQGMVSSRTPTKHSMQSTGHGRRAGSDTPRATLGCLYVENPKGLSQADLKKELLDAADSEGLKYGLRITSLQNRSSGGAGGRGRGNFAAGGGARLLGDPVAIYKVYVSDGHEELVRGCEFNSVDIRSLRKIIASGTKMHIHNSTGGSSPASSVIAPAVLVEEMELTKVKRENEKKPILVPPHAR